MFNRTIIESLKAWFSCPNRKPLVLRGARQVGKTTAVEAFSANYDVFLPLNLEKKADRDLFEQDFDIHELISAIHFHKNQPVDSTLTTLIFIDEIQNSPQAATMLRYFYEERNDIHVISAGSLLETLIDRHVSFPVGRVEYKWMYPLSFSEYLSATNQDEAISRLREIPCPNFAHDRLLKLFHEYVVVGGMPEAVAAFMSDHDILAVNKVYESLVTAYMDDVEKYAPNKTMANVVRHAIQHAPMEAGSRIKFQGFGKSNYKSREVGEALRLLEKAMLIHLVYPTTLVKPPATDDHKKSPKLQFLDTGMMNYAAGLQKHYFGLRDLNVIFQGQVCENIVGQELLANGLTSNEKLKFWVREKKQSNAEVDFVMQCERYLIPVEVKAGKIGTLKSLMQFMELADHPYAVRLYAGTYQKDIMKTPSGKPFILLSLPYYLVEQLGQYVKLMMRES